MGLAATKVLMKFFLPPRVYANGADLLKALKEVKGQAQEAQRPLRECQDNEIYLVEGDRTLVLTSGRIAKDLDSIQEGREIHKGVGI